MLRRRRNSDVRRFRVRVLACSSVMPKVRIALLWFVVALLFFVVAMLWSEQKAVWIALGVVFLILGINFTRKQGRSR